MTWQRTIILLAALALAAATGRLGLWQLDRAAQKTALQAAIDSRALLPPLTLTELALVPATALEQVHRRITLNGEWVTAATIYLDNRQMNGRPGFFVITPLRLGDGSAVLVQRGWQPRAFTDRARVVAPPTPSGPVTVAGRISAGPARLYEFDAAASGAIRQNLDVGAFAIETGLRLRPLTVLQLDDGVDTAAADGLQRDWPHAVAGVQKHYGYAFQWFALCALTIGLYVWFQIIQPRRRKSSAG
jgi:surfeit locus 1 family protein